MTDSKIQPPPLSTYFAQHGSAVAAIELVATDVDGTLTRDGALTAASLGAIEELTAAGLEVVPVSGRPAGEVLGLCRYLPGVRRAIAENGLISVVPDQPVQFIGRPTNPARLREVGDALNADHGANLRLAGDEFCRVGDVAYERDGRDVPELMRLRPGRLRLLLHLRLPSRSVSSLFLLTNDGLVGLRSFQIFCSFVPL